MKAWVVEAGGWMEVVCVGVFSTLEAAKEYMERPFLKGRSFVFDTVWDVDVPEDGPVYF
jgi:hypothetical protein